MTGEKFTEIVTKRANERVQGKIRKFKRKVADVFQELTGERYIEEKETNAGRHANHVVLTILLGSWDFTSKKDGWPRHLWTEEEKAVTKELLSMMDEMQKALIAPGPAEDDCTSA